MLIDWLTLRFPLTEKLGDTVYERIQKSLGRVVRVSPSGEIVWEKNFLDVDNLRSDSPGLFWSVTGDADGIRYLTIGSSPASLENQGVNVFGSADIVPCAQTLVDFAGVAHGFWSERRMPFPSCCFQQPARRIQ